jgi:hypothetical protein
MGFEEWRGRESGPRSPGYHFEKSTLVHSDPSASQSPLWSLETLYIVSLRSLASFERTRSRLGGDRLSKVLRSRTSRTSNIIFRVFFDAA